MDKDILQAEIKVVTAEDERRAKAKTDWFRECVSPEVLLGVKKLPPLKQYLEELGFLVPDEPS